MSDQPKFGPFEPPWKAAFWSELQHGPGIWTVVTDRDDIRDEYEVTEDPSEEIARLWAAAPRMYAFILERAQNGDRDAAEIIAKADGRTPEEPSQP